MFSNYVNFQFDMPIADGTTNMLDTIHYQMQIASQYLYGPHKGPIHFNMPFREPLTPNLDRKDLLKSETKTLPHYQKMVHVDPIKDKIEKPKGLIIVGDMQHQEVDQILTYSTVFDIPVLADPLSQLRRHNHPNVITTYDLLYRAGMDWDVDFVIRVGKPVISKKLNQWLKTTTAFQILVQNNDKIDVFPVPPDVSYEISANDFFRSLMEERTIDRKAWLQQWQSLEKQSRIEINDFLQHATDEAAYVGTLLSKLTNEDALFVSNSMPIRDIDNLLFDNEAEIYANRGANGIDGVVSTALGMAVHKNVTLLIGDLAFYHDMNGLLMSKINDIHLNIVLLNNDGGGIFSYLPQKASAAEYFERLFGTPTGLDFEHAALLYDFNFKRFDHLTDFKFESLSKLGSNVYEVITDREDNLQQHQILYKKLSEMINVIS